VGEKEKTTIAILGTDTAVGWAILLLLREEGYEIRMVEATRAALPDDLMERVDLLLIPQDLAHRRCEEGLAAPRGKREGIGVPVLSLTAVKEGLLHDEEVRFIAWPIKIEELVREIEGALHTTHAGNWSWEDRLTVVFQPTS
jgi:DNA-binding NtrC family response regulator